jgi:transposase
MSYSIDLRERVVNYIENGGSIIAASKLFNLSRVTVYKWLKKKETSGALTDEPPQRVWKKINPQELVEYVKNNPDQILEQYAQHFKVKIPSMWMALKKLKITRKKRPYCTKKDAKLSAQYFWSSSALMMKNQ